MGDVVGFPQQGTPTLEGPVRCMACRHEWRAVSPPGEFNGFECPACHAYKGAYIGMMAPADHRVWVCACGNDLFVLTPTGAPLCPNCGLRATGWVDH